MTFSGNGLSVNVVRQEVSSVRMAFRTSQQSAVIANFNEQAFLTVSTYMLQPKYIATARIGGA